MEVIEDIVIVGAGLAGLATALGLHSSRLPTISWSIDVRSLLQSVCLKKNQKSNSKTHPK
ncbi:putative FAD/NAD(P)-binding domain superfamily [Dioscorea sansibarensis]